MGTLAEEGCSPEERQEAAARKELSHRMHQENEAHGGTMHLSLSSFLRAEEQQPSVAQLRMLHTEEQRAAESCRAGTLHPPCLRGWHKCQGGFDLPFSLPVETQDSQAQRKRVGGQGWCPQASKGDI